MRVTKKMRAAFRVTKKGDLVKGIQRLQPVQSAWHEAEHRHRVTECLRNHNWVTMSTKQVGKEKAFQAAHAVMNVDETRFNGKTDGPMFTVIESALRGRVPASQ